MPALGLGTYKLQGVTCRQVVREALEHGYRHIDTAWMYDNQGDVGGAIQESTVDREEVFLTTKIWHEELSPEALRHEFDRSLQKLDTEFVDLLLIHWPNPDFPLGPTLVAMTDLREQGRLRHIGVSNFTPSLLEEAMKHAPIRCNQIEYHPLLDQSRQLKLLRQHGMPLVAHSPLAQGKVLEEAPVIELAERHERSPSQVVLRWQMQQEGVAAIPRSGNPDHVRANLEIFDFELGDEEMKRISDLARGERLVDPSWAPAWGE
jgi:diketogulonate reductase-like aldo/keto reductase